MSPKGDKLIYFAANWQYEHGPGSWTAISKPLYLSAIALWPKGDGWGGGGLFETEVIISLNHRGLEMNLADGFHLDKKIRIEPLGDHSGGGEDDPIYPTRLIRDNWVLTCEGDCSEPDWDREITWVFEQPRIYQKNAPKKGQDLVLEMQIKGISEQDKFWYSIDHELVTRHHQSILKLPRTSWADLDKNGDLLFAKEGKLFRLPYSEMTENVSQDNAQELADFSNLIFEPKEPLNKEIEMVGQI